MLKIEKLLLLLVVIMMINDDIDCKLIQVGKLKLSEIGIGTWAWGNRLLWGYNEDQDQELFKAYQYSVDNGINWFDTADSYGTGNLNGRSEELLGQFQLKISKSKQPYYLTKLAPYPWRIGENSMIEASKASIKRLNKNIDILQLHWPPSLQWQEREYLSAFSKVITDRKALQIGLSNYGPIGLERVVKILQNYNQKPYSNQVQLSLLSRYPLTSGLVEQAKELGVQLIGYSPLALGLLTDKYSIEKNRLPPGLRGILCREYLPAIQPLLGELRNIAKVRRKTVSQIALNWNVQKGFLLLVGARNIEQVKENLGATGWKLDNSEIEVLDTVARKTKKQFVQNSFQSN